MATKFNSVQLAAIKAPLTEHLVIAGAGSGKTSVLIERIIYLIQEKKIDPQKIWVISFTNKAVNEIKHRISARNIKVPEHISTFHGSFVWVIKKHIHLWKKNQNFRIMDRSKQLSIVKQLSKQYQIIEPPSKILELISLVKLKNFPEEIVSPDVYVQACKQTHSFFPLVLFQTIFRAYSNHTRDEGLMDFDDLLLYCNELLQKEEVQEYWNNKFDAILIDEFQDINQVQFDVIQKILGKKRNIFCVGDPDQSIYGFRGAKPEIFMDFLKIYPSTRAIKLEQNYRSTKKILKVANHLINKSPSGFSKNLFTDNEEGFKIRCFQAKDESKEINWIIQEIKKLVAIGKAKLSDFLILYRNNYLSLPLEKELNNQKMAYQVFGSIKFFDRSEIKIITHYLNLIFFDDVMSLSQVFNVPKRNLGLTTLNDLKAFAEENKKTLFEVIANIKKTSLFTEKKRDAIHNLWNQIQKIRKLQDATNCVDVVEKILTITGYKGELDKEPYRIKNIMFFAEEIQKNWDANKSQTLKDLVSEMSLHMRAFQEQPFFEGLSLSTVHNAKGLEYKYVFVMKMTEKVFPSIQSIVNNQIEDERRLAYVAFTRAKKRLFISSSKQMIFGKLNQYYTEESSFIKDIKMLDDVSYTQH